MGRTRATCPSWAQLKDFHRGAVDQSSCDWIGEHLCECPDCLRCVETLEAAVTSKKNGEGGRLDAISDNGESALGVDPGFNVWRRLLKEAELRQLCQNALEIVPRESKHASRKDLPSDRAYAESFQFVPIKLLDDFFDPRETPPQKIPQFVGDYLIIRQLGQGGFSNVYLAEHRDNGKRVAIKVPRPDKPLSKDSLARYLEEAKKLSMLRHPTIVPIVDWGELKQQQCFVASQWIDGVSLRDWTQQNDSDRKALVSILRQIADGLQHTHESGLVHRDVKSENILVDREGRAYLVDFGLAIRDDQQWQSKGQRAGTRPYMSPEQLRGETHRLDGRTDIWAIGVILYELLVGQRPFHGREMSQLIDEVESRDPKPLRQIDESVPTELERICMKCLQKRITDRYSTAADLSADLSQFLRAKIPQAVCQNTNQLDGVSQSLFPVGVRSFEMSDAEVFCALMPGLRGIDGVPETVRFVCDKLLCREPNATFPIGVIYGPSGSGKSSFVKAGVLPRLDSSTYVVVVEATKHDLESRLRDALYISLPGIVSGSEFDDLSLAELFDRVRRTIGPQKKKLVVIIDQLEQWLSVSDTAPTDPLVSALRHCDGVALQTLLIVRDDFWLATSRLMRSVEIQLADGENAIFIDLFLTSHAEIVLQGFGRAYRALPAHPAPLSRDQRAFVGTTIAGLSQNGRVAPVQIAFVAEILKDETWDPRTLELYGGVEGIGVRFLEKTFTLPTAPVIHRSYATAAQAVLRLLLPGSQGEARTTLKGRSRSEKELSLASGMPLESAEFLELLQILDEKTKLITAVDPIRSDDTEGPGQVRRYQLAHDYLIPSLQEWLARTEAFTWRGRTRQMLRRLNEMWSKYEDTRHLPRLIEWLQIRALIPMSEWTNSQVRMMRQAQTRFLRRGIVALGLMIALAFISLPYLEFVRAKKLVDSFLNSASTDVSRLMEAVDSCHRWSHPQLTNILTVAESTDDRKSQRRALMALVRRNYQLLPKLLGHYREAPLDELVLMNAAMSHVPNSQCDLESLWQDLKNSETPSSERIRIAIFLAHRLPTDGSWQLLADDIARLLLDLPPAEQKQWAVLVQPVAPSVLSQLAAKIVESPNGTTLRIPASLYNELAQATPNGYQPIIDLFDSAMKADKCSIEQAKRAAAAAAALASYGRWDAVDTVFQHTEDPTFQSQLIDFLVESAINFDSLVEQLGSFTDSRTLHGIILTIGDTGSSRSRGARAMAVRRLMRIWHSNGSPGVRHPISWVLRKWETPTNDVSKASEPSEAGSTEASVWNSVGENDFLNHFPVSETNRHRPLEAPMVCFPAGNFSRTDDLGREIRLTISRPFAIGTTEVTVEDFVRFRQAHRWDERKSPTFNCPVNMVSWYDAVAYCNWLSNQCGIPQSQWCYELNELGEYGQGMKVPDDALERLGFRLATAAEWEFACQGSARTQWSFGDDPQLAAGYAWYQANANFRTHSVGELKPNEHGLFDMHGNVWEWCHDKLVTTEFREPFKLGDYRLCGGTYIDGTHELSVNAHNWNPPVNKTDADGFRICRTLPTPKIVQSGIKNIDETQ